MSARVRYAVIYRHREAYPIYRMCGFFFVSRSGYYSYVERLNRPDPNQEIIDQIASQQKRCKNTYGYRRMQLWLDKNGCHKNSKSIFKPMKSHGLSSEIRRRSQWKQLVQQVHKHKNLLNREFHAESPKQEMGTDISCIRTKQGILYLDSIYPTLVRFVFVPSAQSGVAHHREPFSSCSKKSFLSSPPP